MIFGAIFPLVQGCTNQGWKYALFSTFSDLRFGRRFMYPFERYVGKIFLWHFELYWSSFKISQTKVENTQFCRFSHNWNFKVDLDTHFRDNHGHLFLWGLKLFCLMYKVGQTKVEKMNFCRLSWNWVLKVDLDTHLRDKHGYLFLWDLELFCVSFKVGQTKVENIHFCH